MTARDLRFIRWLFRIAAVYGAVALLPMYFMAPPGLSHPLFYYGFVGVAFAWQVAFWIIATDPVRYRWFIVPGVIEKAAFGYAAAYLFAKGKVPDLLALGGVIDMWLAVLFVMAFIRLGTPVEDAAKT